LELFSSPTHLRFSHLDSLLGAFFPGLSWTTKHTWGSNRAESSTSTKPCNPLFLWVFPVASHSVDVINGHLKSKTVLYAI